MRFRILAWGPALLSLLSAVPLQAQTVNYGALEELFGEPVTTSATGSAQKVTDAPVEMEIITADDIRRSGADNIPDILRFVSGVDVHSYGATDADIGIRGYNSANTSRVLVLLNGRQVYVDYYSYTAWATVPVQLEEIRQIEVVKGPNSALFGFNAVSGVINIVTFDPVHDSVNEATFRGGTHNDQQVSAVSTVHLGDDAGLRISGSEHSLSEPVSTASMPASLGPYPSHATNHNVYMDGRAKLANGIDVATEFDVGEARQFELTVGGWPAPTNYGYNRERLQIGSATDLGYINLNVYRNWVRYTFSDGYDCASCTRLDDALFVTQLTDLLKPDVDHIIRLGLEYRNDRAGESIFGSEKIGFDLYAANAMWNWQMNPKMALTNSVRFDYMITRFSGFVDPAIAYTAQQYDGVVFMEPSFNSAFVDKLTDVDTLRVSIARGVQIPNYMDLFPQPNAPGFQYPSLQGTPFVRPSVVMNYEVDFDHDLPDILSKAGIAIFHQTNDNVLATSGDGGAPALGAAGSIAYARNVGSSNATGGELNFKGADEEGWRWKAGYALTYITDHLSVNLDPANPDSSLDPRRGTPTHSIIFGLGRTWRDFEADLSGRWQSSFDEIRVNGLSNAPQPAPLVRYHIGNYVTLNARLGYNLTQNLTMAVSGQQLNASSLMQTSAPLTERRILGSVSLHF